MPRETTAQYYQTSDALLLMSARERVRTHWTKNNYQDHDRYCMVGALAVACGNRRFRLPTWRERRLARLVAKELPFRIFLCWLTGRARLIVFNDSKKTKRHDVLGLFDRAIERATQGERIAPAPSAGSPPSPDIVASSANELPSCRRSVEPVHS
jgi:hypothetical protein